MIRASGGWEGLWVRGAYVRHHCFPLYAQDEDEIKGIMDKTHRNRHQEAGVRHQSIASSIALEGCFEGIMIGRSGGTKNLARTGIAVRSRRVNAVYVGGEEHEDAPDTAPPNSCTCRSGIHRSE